MLCTISIIKYYHPHAEKLQKVLKIMASYQISTIVVRALHNQSKGFQRNRNISELVKQANLYLISLG